PGMGGRDLRRDFGAPPRASLELPVAPRLRQSVLAREDEGGRLHAIRGRRGKRERRIPRLSKKGFRTDEVRAAARLFRSPHAPELCVNFIVGHPWDTVETIRETVDFANELQREAGARCGFFLMVPFPGSVLWNRAREYGLEIQENWGQFRKITFSGN